MSYFFGLNLFNLRNQEGDWKAALAKAMEELDGKLDRMELTGLKDWLEKQLKAMNSKIKSLGGQGNLLDEEAAGMKKLVCLSTYLYNCLPTCLPFCLTACLHACLHDTW